MTNEEKIAALKDFLLSAECEKRRCSMAWEDLIKGYYEQLPEVKTERARQREELRKDWIAAGQPA